MREGGFTLIEVLVALALLGLLAVLTSANFDARSRAALLDASIVQARLLADTAEVERRRDVSSGEDDETSSPLPLSPFGGTYDVEATEHTSVVSFDVPFGVRGGGVFTAREGGGGTLRIAPSVFSPTSPMRDKALLYLEPLP